MPFPARWARGRTTTEWTEEQVTAMAGAAYRLPHMWDHALGAYWEARITIDDIKALYYRL